MKRNASANPSYCACCRAPRRGKWVVGYFFLSSTMQTIRASNIVGEINCIFRLLLKGKGIANWKYAHWQVEVRVCFCKFFLTFLRQLSWFFPPNLVNFLFFHLVWNTHLKQSPKRPQHLQTYIFFSTLLANIGEHDGRNGRSSKAKKYLVSDRMYFLYFYFTNTRRTDTFQCNVILFNWNRTF